MRVAATIRPVFTSALWACLAAFSLACGPSSDSPPPAAEPAQRFSVESVEVGVRFDESVFIEGTTGTTNAARVALVSEGSSGIYGGTVRASDAAGNTTELDLEVTVDEP